MALQKTIYLGPFVHCKSLTELDICPIGAIGVDENGTISFMDRDAKVNDYAVTKEGWAKAEIVRIKDAGFFFPGFIGMRHYLTLPTFLIQLQSLHALPCFLLG